MRLTETQKQNIRNKIREVERKTAGELVTIIARKSDRYRFVSLFWAAIIVLCFPLIIAWFYPYWLQAKISLISFAVFVILWLVLDFTYLKFYLVPKHIAHERASTKAHEAFVRTGVHLTREHTGILLYVSIAERFVEVIADKGISSVVEQDKWQHIIDNFTAKVKEREVEAGFIEAIEALGEILANHVPSKLDDVNELSDHLIEID